MSIKALIIDAHPVYSKKLDGFLNSLGINDVNIATSAEEGLNQFRTHSPQLVVLSATLPGKEFYEDGFLIGRQIKKMAGDAVKIIVLTGLFEDHTDLRRQQENRIDAVLPRKEKDLRPLEETISRLLSSKPIF